MVRAWIRFERAWRRRGREKAGVFIERRYKAAMHMNLSMSALGYFRHSWRGTLEIATCN